MKNIFTVIAAVSTAAILSGFTNTAFAQADAGLATQFVDQAKSAGDSQLGVIASELTGKMQAFGALLGTNAAIKETLDSTLKSLTGGKDSEALASAFKLAEAAKFTPAQLGLAKQVGNLASAYVVQKNFATLEGAQGDVATIVSSLRDGKIKSAIPSLKNVAQNGQLTDGQKQIITTVADKYAPGWKAAKNALDSVRKLPGF